MKHTSVKLDRPIELVNITSISPLISKCVIKVCWVGDSPNRNGTIITKEVAADLAQSLPGSPIVGFFSEEAQDFLGHEQTLIIEDGELKFKEITRPYGFVDLNAKVWFEKFLDDGVVEREYLVTEGYLWTGQYPECQRVIDIGNNQSMELDPEKTKMTGAKLDNGAWEFFIVNEAVMSKLCILGEEVEPCFEGADIKSPTLQFSFGDEFKTQLLDMMNEIKEYMLKGGNGMTENNGTPVLDVVENQILDNEATEFAKKKEDEEGTKETGKTDPATEDPKTEGDEPKVDEDEEDKKKKHAAPEDKDEDEDEKICPECGKPLDECTCDEEKEKKYNLEEIPEYQEISGKYDDLQNQYSLLLEEVESLRNFKLSIDKKEKEAMIAQFYMLSDEDKKEVIDNIDNYSVDEIESKLSVICVRNKVSFSSEETEVQTSGATSYNLNETQQDELMPAWVRSVKAVRDTENL